MRVGEVRLPSFHFGTQASERKELAALAGSVATKRLSRQYWLLDKRIIAKSLIELGSVPKRRVLVTDRSLLYAELMARDFATSSSQYLTSIDAEIERLQTLREQVSAAVDADDALSKPAKAIRKGMSEEGRRKIAAAQKARWAKQKKAAKALAKPAARKASAKKSTVKRAAAKKSAARTTGPAQE